MRNTNCFKELAGCPGWEAQLSALISGPEGAREDSSSLLAHTRHGGDAGCPLTRVPQHDTRHVDLMDLLYLRRCLHTHARSRFNAWFVSEAELRLQQHLSQHLFRQLHEGAAVVVLVWVTGTRS